MCRVSQAEEGEPEGRERHESGLGLRLQVTMKRPP